MTTTKNRPPSAKAHEQSLGERFKNAIENEPPIGENEREAFWLDTLHLAMVELRAELKSENLKVRSKAAHKIIDLERTKLRHAKRSSLESRLQPVLVGPEKRIEDGLKPELQHKQNAAVPDFVGVPPLGGLAGQNENEDRLKAELQRNQDTPLAGRASDGNSEDPSLAFPVNKMAEIEAGAIDMLALDIQTMTAKLAEKLQLKDRSMTTPGAARAIIARYMRVNEVTALKIDPHDIALVVMNMMADYKEHEEAADAKGDRGGVTPQSSHPATGNTHSAGAEPSPPRGCCFGFVPA
jgi:hypothetical protein